MLFGFKASSQTHSSFDDKVAWGMLQTNFPGGQDAYIGNIDLTSGDAVWAELSRNECEIIQKYSRRGYFFKVRSLKSKDLRLFAFDERY